MNPGICFEKVWEDNDMSEVRIIACDGKSSFQIDVYVAHDDFPRKIKEIKIFKEQIYGGIYDLEFGSFGPEYARGAFFARFHFAQEIHGKINISIKMESEFFPFGKRTVASKGVLFLRTEPVLIDQFTEELKYFDTTVGSRVELKCIKTE